MTLTEISIKRSTIVVVIFTALIVLGILSYTTLSYELLPDISVPYVSVMITYPGASPKVVETSVTKVIEESLSSLDKVKNIQGNSREGVSFVTVEFTQSANVDFAVQEVQRKVNQVTADLPTDANDPIISKIALDDLPILKIGATSRLKPPEFAQFLKDSVRPALSKIGGVGQISLVGQEEREIRVNLDKQKLRSYNLPLLQIVQAVNAANLDFPTGKVKDIDGQFIVRIAGRFQSLDELRNLIVGRGESGDVRLGDIAEVQDTVKETVNISRLNGKPSVGILIQKQTDANTVDVSKRVRDSLQELERDYAKIGLKFTVSQDSSTFTLDAANAVKKDLLFAIVLVALVMLIFLHSIRNSLIVMVAIPCSLISTFTAMYLFDFSLNLMSLLAMSLVIGILVDDSIVVLENIYRHLEMGKDRRTAALDGRSEIGFTAISITMVDVAVFLPLSLVSGIVGDLIRQYSVVMIVSTLLSLFVSFTVTPLLASRFAKLEHPSTAGLMGRFGFWFEKRYDTLTQYYGRLLEWGIGHPKSVASLALGLLLFAFSLVPLGFIGSEFMEVTDRGEFTVTLELEPGAKLTKTNEKTLIVEKEIAKIPEVTKIFTNVGSSSDGFIGQSSNNNAEISVTLVDKRRRSRSTDDVILDIKRRIAKVPGIKVRVNPIGVLGSAEMATVYVGVDGPNLEEVQEAAKTVERVVRAVPGTSDVRLSSQDGNPETRIEIDREKMASFGFSLGEVGSTLQAALSGNDDSKYQEGANEYPIRIQLDQFDRSKTSEIENLTFVSPRKEQVELQQFARVSQSTGPTKLERVNRNYSISVQGEAFGRPSGDIHNDIRKLLEKESLPSSVNIRYEGVEMQEEAFGYLLMALAAAILFVYLVMVALYDSYSTPFVVLFSIPVAVVGAFLALAFTIKSLNVFTLVGMIMLIGLVAKNAILLVDFTNKLRGEGLDLLSAVREAGKIRLRPILMTTLAMVFGMLPIALASSSGSEMKNGLGWVLIGGLTSSLLLTLVLVPVVYIWMARKKERFQAWRESRQG
ncbi:MAG TPA: efflux RND transporter permease subunit [Candidatus Aminicenantes bacterium]|nr:efflux RND transporter permease subunit [Candidatus Aminicenantes bacterium]HPB55622.1 efflux RND transporter permease subunit [Candidatus Aminicenantes bacterium]HPT00598.1 efflux RND transporter permease subunit [Candidatus Aminicenantes bacterium]